MKQFSQWFEGASGYTLHKISRRELRGACPCGAAPEMTRATAQLPREPGAAPLCRCPVCGRLFAKLPGGYLPLEDPLQYRVIGTL